MLALSCGGPSAPRWPESAAVTRAVAAGTRYLLTLPPDVSADARLRAHVMIYRLTPDEVLAAKFAPLIETEQREWIALASSEPADMERGPDGTPHLMRLMSMLIVARANGTTAEAARERVQGVLTGAQRHIEPWLATNVGWSLWFGYAVSKLELSAWTNVGTEIARVRALPPGATPAQDLLRLYALTHVVFYLSDYGSRYLDAADSEFERTAFGAALRFFRAQPLTDDTADLAGEILACEKLTGVPPDDDATALRDLVAARQNPDGSWGSRAVDRYHRTLTALLGLMQFRSQPRARFGGY